MNTQADADYVQWFEFVGKSANENIEFALLRNPKYEFNASDSWGGLSEKISPLPNEKALVGQDPRLLQLDDNTIFIAYSNRFTRYIRMGMALVHYNEGDSKLEYRNISGTIRIDRPQIKNTHQKNWSPFLYNKTVHFVQSINPLVVMQMSWDSSSEQAVVKDFSSSPHVHLKWRHGELRGGTNAIFVGDRYLSFFHSVGYFPNNPMKTYVMGGYTFSAEPPFRLLEYSLVPITHEMFLTGPWDPLKNRGIDYCFFPMSFYLEDNVIVLSFGFNDKYGFLAKMELSQVMRSLTPIAFPTLSDN